MAADRGAFTRAIAEKLIAGKALGPKTHMHTTDFQGDSLGRITLTTRELRHFGYRGPSSARTRSQVSNAERCVLMLI